MNPLGQFYLQIAASNQTNHLFDILEILLAKEGLILILGDILGNIATSFITTVNYLYPVVAIIVSWYFIMAPVQDSVVARHY